MKKNSWLFYLGLFIVVLYTLWWRFAPPPVASGWSYEEVMDNLESVSAIGFNNNGTLYATIEKTKGKGKLLRIKAGQSSVVLKGLNKPDGLAVIGDLLLLTSEASNEPLITFDGHNKQIVTADLMSAEGISVINQHEVVIAEDRKGAEGRIVKVDIKTGELQELVTGLDEPEGVCVATDGSIYFVEKNKSSIQRIFNKKITTIKGNLNTPSYLNCLTDGSILITEDRTLDGRLLRFKDNQFEVILKRLHSPQTVIVSKDGSYLLAEQGRGRILKLMEKDND